MRVMKKEDLAKIIKDSEEKVNRAVKEMEESSKAFDEKMKRIFSSL